MIIKAQMCYTDENLEKRMLITTVGINSQREQHLISTIKTVQLTENVNLLEDGGGTYYISYKRNEKNIKKKVYMGRSKTPPVTAKPMYIKGFEARELDGERNGRINSVERRLRLDILSDEILHYGDVYVCDAILLADQITAVIRVNSKKC